MKNAIEDLTASLLHSASAEDPLCDLPYSPEPGGWRGFRATSFKEEDVASKRLHLGMDTLWKSAFAVGYHTRIRTLKSFGRNNCGNLSLDCWNWKGYPHELPVPYFHTGRWSYIQGGGYIPGGVAALSDLVLTHFGIWGNLDVHPKVVTFPLQAREAFFNTLTSEKSWVKEPIVVIGMEDDCTIPVGLDPRGWCANRAGIC